MHQTAEISLVLPISLKLILGGQRQTNAGAGKKCLESMCGLDEESLDRSWNYLSFGYAFALRNADFFSFRFVN
jgi:hypothetical protein